MNQTTSLITNPRDSIYKGNGVTIKVVVNLKPADYAPIDTHCSIENTL